MEILNTGLYNFQGDIVSVKALGQNLKDNTLALYNIDIPVHEALSGLPKERLLGRMREKTNIFDTKGDLTGITTQNAIINDFTASLTIADNSIFELDNSVVDGYRNVLEALLLGETFSDGTNQIKILGVGGNVKLASGMLRNKDFKYFFEKDNKLKKAYTGSETANVFLGAYNKDSLAVCLEIYGTSNSENVQVLKYGAVVAGNSSFSEADDKNNVATDVTFASDFRTYSQPMHYGLSVNDIDSPTATTIYRIKTTYIVAGAKLELSDLTAFGKIGETVAVIDTDTGAVECGTTNGTDAWTAFTGGLGAGCLIFSDSFGASADLSDQADEFNYVAIKTAGVTGTGVAVGTTVTSQTEYTLATTYTLPIYNFTFSTGNFVKVVTSANL